MTWAEAATTSAAAPTAKQLHEAIATHYEGKGGEQGKKLLAARIAGDDFEHVIPPASTPLAPEVEPLSGASTVLPEVT